MKYALIALLILSGCSTIDYSRSPEDFPVLRVVENFVPYEMVRAKCNNPPWFLTIFACMTPDFDNNVCNLWYPADHQVYEWVRSHELEHCKGYDHPRSTELRDLWQAWKARNGIR